MLTRILNGLCAAAGAGGAAQFPAFYRQYLQQVSGRAAQAAEDLRPVIADAEARGLTVPDYLAQAAGEGGALTGTLVAGYRGAWETLRRLEEAYAALSGADVLARPVAFARHFDGGIAVRTFQDFAPALPLTTEGLAYAGVGALVGIAAAWGLEAPARAWRRRRRTARKIEQQKGESR